MRFAPTHVCTWATPSLCLLHRRRPTRVSPWSGRSSPRCSAAWLWGHFSGGSGRKKDENVSQLRKLSVTHRTRAVCLEPDSSGRLGPNVYSSWKKWLPLLISPFCELMPACYPPANDNLAVLHISRSNTDSSWASKGGAHSSESGYLLTVNVLRSQLYEKTKMQGTRTSISICYLEMCVWRCPTAVLG